jgi:putative DNA primase/helicase
MTGVNDMAPHASNGSPAAPHGAKRAADVPPRAIEWFWHPFIPLGKLSLLAGKPGQGKSLATAWLAARATTGGAPGDAIILSAEDDPEDTVRPRLEAAGADLDRCWLVGGAEIDVQQLGLIADDVPAARLLTIDPVAGFLPSSCNAWKTQDVRRFLEPLRVFAMERRIAVVLVQHLNRRSDSADAMDRIADSAGLPQLCRSVLIWGPDPADPEGDHGTRKVLARTKGNLAKASASATFMIEERGVTGAINAPMLVRGDDRAVTADDVIASAETRTDRDEAAEWLKTLLADGPVPAKEVRKRAREDGIADRTLDRAKKAAGAVSRSQRSESGITAWSWEIPTSPTGTYNSGVLDVLGDLGDVPTSPRSPTSPTPSPQSALGADCLDDEGAVA